MKKELSTLDKSIKKSIYTMGIAVFVILCICVGVVVRYMMKMSSYQKEAPQHLAAVSSYKSRGMFNGKRINGITSDSLYSLIEGEQKIAESIQKNEKILHKFRRPYNAFLRYIYLPSLNVWKNSFTKKIDTDLMGASFLEKNPYTDIALINTWTDFFKSMGLQTYNEIESIKVDEIVEEGDDFYVPISVDFVAPSRRAFLFLLDKLALTSDKNNIMLTNDFFYYLWMAIEKENGDGLVEKIQKIVKEQDKDIIVNKENLDQMMGYVFTKRKTGEIKEMPLLTQKVMIETIRTSSLCDENKDLDVCLFDFREKYRSIPRLAYGLGYSKVKGGDILQFIQGISPLLVIEDFDFEKNNDKEMGGGVEYTVSLSLKVYGKGMRVDEVGDIAQNIGETCFQREGEVMSIEGAIELIDQKISTDMDPVVTNRQRSKNLLEVKGILQEMSQEYTELTPYKQSIKLFETYRMMDEMLLCK